MTEHHVHNAPFSKRTANRIARRRLSRAIITCGLLAAALIVVIFSPQKSGLTQRASVESRQSQAIPAAELTKIAPADVVGTGVTWSPLTGCGSN